MNIEYHKWWSPYLQRDMELKIYGHGGIPYLVFPCSRGRFHDYEDFGMVHEISYFIDTGKIKLFTVDSVDGESWYNFSILPGDRNRRHEQYDQYISDEVVPFIRQHYNQEDVRIMLTGCSMGAFHTINFFLKHPELFCGTIALSGLYRLDRIEFGLPAHDIPHVFFNSPLTYFKDLNEPALLEWYMRSTIIICTGQGAWEEETLQDTRALHHLFMQKSIPAWVDYWGHDVNHDWPWWSKQMRYFLGHLYP